MLKLVIFITLVVSSFCAKLSEEFDTERAETCGIINKPEKQSSNSADHLAPWSMGIEIQNEMLLSAILVSPRHVVASSGGIIGAVGNRSKEWKWVDGSAVDIRQCKENEMKIPVKVLKVLKVWISICADSDQCGTDIRRSVVEGYYIGNCELGEQPFGFLLLEISSNVPQDEPFFTPVCVPSEKDPVKPKDNVHFVSLTPKKTKEGHVIRITSSGATIEKCNAKDINQFNFSICGKRSKCPKDTRSGSLVKKINDRDTIVAFLYSEYKGCVSDHYISIGFFKDKLCSLAGICKKTITVETSSSGRIQLISLILIISFVL